jgi:predicted DNA binding CopG/RHH family protein
MENRRNYQELGEIELSQEMASRVNTAIEQAEQDLAITSEVRVNFRWGASQLAAVKRAADLMGVPYQTYIKVAVYRQAMADLRGASDFGESEYGDDQKPHAGLRLVQSNGG